MAQSRKLNNEMTCQDMAKEDVENTCKDDDVVIKTEQSLDEELHVGGPELPMPCPGSYADANIHVEIQNADEKVHKYLEIEHHVETKQSESSHADLFQNKENEKPVPCKASVLGVTPNIEMTYLHKKDEEKVDKYRYMTLDEDRKRREDLGRYEALCASSTCVNVQPPAQESNSALGSTSAAENLNTDDTFDEVMPNNENSSDASGGDYEEPDVVNLEGPPVPGRSPQGVTPREISDYQELP